MRRQRIRGPSSDRLAGWCRWAQLPAVAAGLGLAELALVAQAGTPGTQLDVLRDLTDPGADPLACLLASLILVAEALVAYLLAVLGLQTLSMLQGAAGRLAARMMLLITPVTVRRMLDLLVGGSLLAQAALAFPSAPSSHPDAPGRAMIDAAWARLDPLPAAVPPPVPMPPPLATTDVRATGAGSGGSGMRAVQTPPTPRQRSAPLPPWLGGGPSRATPEPSPATAGSASLGTRRPDPGHTVQRHDTLWDIAAANLSARTRSTANIHRYWQQIYRANRSVVGADPDLIHPGTHLDVPPYRRDHR